MLEVLTVSVLLAFFLVGFFEGSRWLAFSTRVQQNRTEALMQSRRVGESWRAGVDVSGITEGYFLNGTTWTLGQNTTAYTSAGGAAPSSGTSLKRLSLTLGWREADPTSAGSRQMKIHDVYFKY